MNAVAAGARHLLTAPNTLMILTVDELNRTVVVHAESHRAARADSQGYICDK